MLNRMEDSYKTKKTLTVNTPLGQIPGLPMCTLVDTFRRISIVDVVSA
jgi:hypothetical protein